MVMSWPSEDWESSQDWDLEQKVAVKTRPPEAIDGILRNKWRDADCPDDTNWAPMILCAY